MPKPWVNKDGFAAESYRAMQIQAKKETPVKPKSLFDVNQINRPKMGF